MAEIIIFIFSGIFIGIAAGLFGLGGGLVIVPVVTYCLVYFSNTPFDQAIIIGISTSLASMVITGAMAAYAHSKNNNVDHRIIKRFFPGLILGSIAIGFFIKSFPGDLLKYFFIFYAFAIAYKLFKHQEVLKKILCLVDYSQMLLVLFFRLFQALLVLAEQPYLCLF